MAFPELMCCVLANDALIVLVIEEEDPEEGPSNLDNGTTLLPCAPVSTKHKRSIQPWKG